MSDLLSAALLLVALLAVAGLAHAVLPHLPETHRSADTRDMVRLVSSLIVTFAALVLGLIIASVNTAFFNNGNDMNALAGSVRQTDGCLKTYGPVADPQRRLLRRYLVGVIVTTWPEEPPPPGDVPDAPSTGPGFESLTLGDLLQQVRMGLLALDPPDDLHKRIATLCASDMTQVLTDRWKLIEEAHSTISTPFYRILALMLAVVFACFGLSAPRNLLAWLTVGLAAFIIAAAVFVVLELDGPLDGVIKVSSASMRAALVNVDR
ncbi:MAG TPA: hypothetical protein VH414_10495 [Lichenihabitans sp.]|jgi:hypothetical protein|nr:hypothetical protein [Lichenihabitans sp.]